MVGWRGKLLTVVLSCCHFKEIFQTSASKMTNSRYCQLSYVVTSKLLATHFKFYFLSLKYGIRMRKKNTQESEDEWWARLDKRIEG